MSSIRTLTLAAAALLVTAGLVVGSTTIASAHERRQVGDIWMSVGFLSEPAFLNGQNGLDLTVFRLKPGTDPAAQTAADRVPITGLEKTLKAEVIKDGQTMPLNLTARFGTAGAYNGVFFPTAAGDYTFHITGTVEGATVDQRFTSGNGFNKVEPNVELQFPVKIGATQDVLAKVSSLESSAKAAATPVAAMEAKQTSAGGGSALSIIALVLGAAGAALGGLALARGRS